MVRYPTQCCNPCQSRSFLLSVLISSNSFEIPDRTGLEISMIFFNGNAYRFFKHHGCIPLRIFRNSGYQSSWLICFVCYLRSQNTRSFLCCFVYDSSLKHISWPHMSMPLLTCCNTNLPGRYLFEILQKACIRHRSLFFRHLLEEAFCLGACLPILHLILLC